MAPPTTVSMLAEYAKTGRSTCRGCKTAIPSGAIRFGIEPPQGESSEERGYVVTQWFHASKACMGQYRKSKGWWEKNCPGTDKIRGLDILKEKDQSKVRSVLGLLRSDPSSEATTIAAESGSSDSGSDASDSGGSDSHQRSSEDESADEGNENAEEEEQNDECDTNAGSGKSPIRTGSRTNHRAPANRPASIKQRNPQNNVSSHHDDNQDNSDGSSSADEGDNDNDDSSSDNSDTEVNQENRSGAGSDDSPSGTASNDETGTRAGNKHAPKRKAAKSKEQPTTHKGIEKTAAPKGKSEQSRLAAKSKTEKEPNKRRKTEEDDTATTPVHGSGRRGGSAAAAGAAANSYSAKALTDEQLSEVRSLITKYSSLTIPALKVILKKNNQTANRTKMELVFRVAEGKCLGALTKCPTCSRGQLDWDRDSGKYSCPGFFDLSKGGVVKCSFESDSLERSPWED